MYEQITYDVDDPVGLITLNRPERLNAWTTQMGNEVMDAVGRAERDPDVVGIVVTGAGRGFCAGADLKVLSNIGSGRVVEGAPAATVETPGDEHMVDFRGTYTYLLSVTKPVIAAVNGAVAGMAVPIALCCDMRFASDEAMFTTAFSQRGLIAEWGSAWLLPRLIGPAAALDLLMSARKVGAEEALRLGLVNRVVSQDQLLQETRTYVEYLAENCSPTSLKIMKRQVWEQLARPLGESEAESIQLMVETFGRPDFKEGVTAFGEKRKPNFPRLGDTEVGGSEVSP